jgi:hypothetical protein
MYFGTLSSRGRRRGVRATRPALVRKLTGRGGRFTGAAGESSSLLELGSSAALGSAAGKRVATTAQEVATRASSDCCSAASLALTASTCRCCAARAPQTPRSAARRAAHAPAPRRQPTSCFAGRSRRESGRPPRSQRPVRPPLASRRRKARGRARRTCEGPYPDATPRGDATCDTTPRPDSMTRVQSARRPGTPAAGQGGFRSLSLSVGSQGHGATAALATAAHVACGCWGGLADCACATSHDRGCTRR